MSSFQGLGFGESLEGIFDDRLESVFRRHAFVALSLLGVQGNYIPIFFLAFQTTAP